MQLQISLRLQKAIKAEQEKDEEGGAAKPSADENDDQTSENSDVKMSEEKSDDKSNEDTAEVSDEKKDDTKVEVTSRSSYFLLEK